jgi:hypothetical protein
MMHTRTKMTGMKFLFFFLFALGISSLSAQTSTETSPDTTKKKKNKQLFEMSFGQSKLFISSAREQTILDSARIVVPTNAILLFAEFRPSKRFRIPVFFSLATGPKHFSVNGILVSERASPTFGTGIECKVFRKNFGVNSGIEFEVGPLASFLFNKGGQIQVAPVIAGRFRFIKREDFIMYIGSSYSFGINAVGIFYGTGYVF